MHKRSTYLQFFKQKFRSLYGNELNSQVMELFIIVQISFFLSIRTEIKVIFVRDFFFLSFVIIFLSFYTRTQWSFMDIQFENEPFYLPIHTITYFMCDNVHAYKEVSLNFIMYPAVATYSTSSQLQKKCKERKNCQRE